MSRQTHNLKDIHSGPPTIAGGPLSHMADKLITVETIPELRIGLPDMDIFMFELIVGNPRIAKIYVAISDDEGYVFML